MTTPDRSSPAVNTQIRRNGRLIFFGLVALCLLFVVGYVQRSGEKAAVEADISALRKEIAQAQLQHAVLQDQLKNIDQPGAIDAAARDDLGLIQRGDQPIVVLDPPASAMPPVAPALAILPSTDAVRPDWLRWLDALFPVTE